MSTDTVPFAGPIKLVDTFQVFQVAPPYKLSRLYRGNAVPDAPVNAKVPKAGAPLRLSTLLGSTRTIYYAIGINANVSSTIYTTASSLGRSYALAGSDQGLPLLWTFLASESTTSGSASVSGNTVAFYSFGYAATHTLKFTASFESTIMTRHVLSPLRVTLSVSESFLAPITIGSLSGATVSSTSAEQASTYTLPSSDQGQTLYWSFASPSTNNYTASTQPSLSGNTLTYYTNGGSKSYSVYLLASFDAGVNATYGLGAVALTLAVTETFTAAASGGILFSTMSASVDTAKTQIMQAGGTLFAVPITGALAESLLKTNGITDGGQYNIDTLYTSFVNNKLYGTFFLDNVRKFSIEWKFTDGTDSMHSLFQKSNTNSLGALYTFNIYDADGTRVYSSSSARRWCFSDGMQYGSIDSRTYLSADDGVWGATDAGDLDPNQGNRAGLGLHQLGGWGMQNYDSGDSSYPGLFINSSEYTAGLARAFIYMGNISAGAMQALTSGTDLYLRGAMLLIGINKHGTLGGESAVSGLDPSVNLSAETPAIVFNPLGLSSTKINPDYTFPGSPADGWVLGVNGSINIVNNRGNSSQNVSGSVTNQTSGQVLKGSWTGTYTGNSLNITMTMVYQFQRNSSYVKCTCTFTNNTASALSNVVFVRGFDPDNDQFLGGEFQTKNGASNTSSMNIAYAISTGGNLLNNKPVPTIYIASKEADVLAGYGGFAFSNAYNSEMVFTNNVGSETLGDIAIGLKMTIGTISAYSSATREFYIGLWDSTSNPPSPVLQ